MMAVSGLLIASGTVTRCKPDSRQKGVLKKICHAPDVANFSKGAPLDATLSSSTIHF
jgi:hypothetical protein